MAPYKKQQGDDMEREVEELYRKIQHDQKFIKQGLHDSSARDRRRNWCVLAAFLAGVFVLFYLVVVLCSYWSSYAPVQDAAARQLSSYFSMASFYDVLAVLSWLSLIHI